MVFRTIIYLNKMRRIYCLLIISLISLGCGALNYHLNSVSLQAKKIYKVRKDYEEKYLGKNKELLLRDFGDPDIKYNVLHSGSLYQEEWSYRTCGNWLQTDAGCVAWFYINTNIVGSISVS